MKQGAASDRADLLCATLPGTAWLQSASDLLPHLRVAQGVHVCELPAVRDPPFSRPTCAGQCCPRDYELANVMVLLVLN